MTKERWGVIFEIVTLLVGIALIAFQTEEANGYGSLDIVGLVLVGVSAVDVYLRKATENRKD